MKNPLGIKYPIGGYRRNAPDSVRSEGNDHWPWGEPSAAPPADPDDLRRLLARLDTGQQWNWTDRARNVAMRLTDQTLPEEPYRHLPMEHLFYKFRDIAPEFYNGHGTSQFAHALMSGNAARAGYALRQGRPWVQLEEYQDPDRIFANPGPPLIPSLAAGMGWQALPDDGRATGGPRYDAAKVLMSLLHNPMDVPKAAIDSDRRIENLRRHWLRKPPLPEDWGQDEIKKISQLLSRHKL